MARTASLYGTKDATADWSSRAERPTGGSEERDGLGEVALAGLVVDRLRFAARRVRVGPRHVALADALGRQTCRPSKKINETDTHERGKRRRRTHR